MGGRALDAPPAAKRDEGTADAIACCFAAGGGESAVVAPVEAASVVGFEAKSDATCAACSAPAAF